MISWSPSTPLLAWNFWQSCDAIKAPALVYFLLAAQPYSINFTFKPTPKPDSLVATAADKSITVVDERDAVDVGQVWRQRLAQGSVTPFGRHTSLARFFTGDEKLVRTGLDRFAADGPDGHWPVVWPSGKVAPRSGEGISPYVPGVMVQAM